MVKIEEDISPFSFFRFLFINHASFKDGELDHVLEHEKAHIRQKHSMDHLFVHLLAVFQWFNPFAWQMRKALKTTHEYIADRQVLNRGIELFDYQALLLKQVIGYHSVEFVNNFNLKPIKKRIAMMNKTRSGISARLKAVLVIPITLSIFFLFVDFTLKGSSTASDPLKALNGLWIKQSEDKFSEMLYFKDGNFAYVEGKDIRQYEASLIEEGRLAFKQPRSQWATTYVLKEDQLDFEWNPWEEKSRYVRSEATNSLDQMLLDNTMKMDLPHISQYRLLEDERLIYRIGIAPGSNGEAQFSFNGEKTEVDEISWRVNKYVGELSLPEMSQATGVFLVDRSVPMSEVEKVRMELREATRYRVAEGGYPHGDLELSPLLYHAVALVRLLPPLDAKILDKEVVEEMGGKVHTINLSDRNTSPGEVDQKLRKFIEDTGPNKYVISLEYDKDIPYGHYVETVDMIYNIIYSFRNKLAMEKYVVPYEKLGDELQRELRKVYPLALSETLH
jgi:biopolymer transport protein ExbD